ncbi:MAG: aspartyl-tRNA(Asn)/glutamyl-tRNA(Gln) amidotransferase subunit [Chloroflexota bacterium]|jgi:aspartyl-tRNA(Asn)/glutamyl-tRNA(Gln) amidotransferase subunit A|nr:aspartyl-tRNA(Asn)/glutamyl-tRNA(Gln) amidotransferase subunit [Chloroflexota bacterium]
MPAVEALTTAPLAEIARSLRQRRVSPLELVDAYSRRIEAASGLQAFITLPGERARQEARRAERRLARGEAGALLGVPIAVKDLFATRATRTTAGSRILKDWVPSRDAAAVAQLRAAGAIIFGKTNLHEFAYGVSTANPWWGVARNPRDPTRSPGGSSGGSAIAVVAGLCAGALGSDTGGSIRVPASLCGCVGFKPTFGAIPLDGAIPLGWSLDHAGPLARTVADAGLLLDVLTGMDAGRRARRVSTRGLRVGVLKGPIVQKAQPRVLHQVDAAADALRRRGLRVREVTIPQMEWTVATQLVTLRAEASAVHSRWIRTRPRAYGADVRTRLQLGVLVGGADYLLAQRMRGRLRTAIGRVFQDVDVLLLPTTPITAPVIGDRTVRWHNGEEPVDGALVRLTAPFNLTGLPALSVPFGYAGGLPVGVQVVGPWMNEARVLAVGRLIEELAEA